MNAKPIRSALDYHEAVSYERHQLPRHWLDWPHVPQQGKTYATAVPTRLSKAAALPHMSLWELVGSTAKKPSPKGIDFETLSGTLGTAYGFTAQQKMGGQMYRYRGVPSAGALYPAELYLAWPGEGGLPPGFYHYDIHTFSLNRLRDKDPLPAVTGALGRRLSRWPQASFLVSGIFFRSAWKYLKRGFRYVLLDAGHLIENLVLSQRMFGLSGPLAYDFDDEALGRLAGLDPKREACLACLLPEGGGDPAGFGEREGAAPMPSLGEAYVSASRVSSLEVAYPEIEAIHRISCQTSTRDRTAAGEIPVVDGAPEAWLPVEPSTAPPDAMPFVEAVRRRRSRRNFKDEPLPAGDLMRLLELVCAPLAEPRHREEDSESCLSVGFLASQSAGVTPGFYLVSRARRAYGLVSAGNFNPAMASVCLDQAWLKFASVQFLFMANLREIDGRRGPRGYRHAMMDAGRLAQRLYLGAAALGLGCCGIGALYDAEAKELLSLNEGSYLLYLVAVGIRAGLTPGLETFS